MNISQVAQGAALTVGLGLALGASAPAMAIGHYVTSNGPDKCSSFTPGTANTIRNRVSGAQNVGTQSLAVACVFELDEIYLGGSVTIDDLQISFLNDNPGSVNVQCTLLPGVSGDFGVAETKSEPVAGGGGTSTVSWTGPWNVFGMGVNCTVPPNVTLYQTLIRYQDDGING